MTSRAGLGLLKLRRLAKQSQFANEKRFVRNRKTLSPRRPLMSLSCFLLPSVGKGAPALATALRAKSQTPSRSIVRRTKSEQALCDSARMLLPAYTLCPAILGTRDSWEMGWILSCPAGRWVLDSRHKTLSGLVRPNNETHFGTSLNTSLHWHLTGPVECAACAKTDKLTIRCE
jgi:hypothetical protein